MSLRSVVIGNQVTDFDGLYAWDTIERTVSGQYYLSQTPAAGLDNRDREPCEVSVLLWPAAIERKALPDLNRISSYPERFDALLQGLRPAPCSLYLRCQKICHAITRGRSLFKRSSCAPPAAL